MARKLRLHVSGGFYHVTLRGNHRQPIFFCDQDRSLLDGIAAEVTSRLAARVHAYCWMTNHVHLLMQVSDVPLGRVILCIASRYARTVQSRIGTTGHLFERRHHAVLVDADSRLLAVLRYIHLNPVRAGLVSDPAMYPWSSHADYIGQRTQEWVTTGLALSLLAACPDAARTMYRRFMASQDSCRWGTGVLAPHPDHPQVLGGDEFVARVTTQRWRPRVQRTLEDLVLEGARNHGVTAELLKSTSKARILTAARAWISHEAVAGRVASASTVARYFGCSETAIRRLMARHPRIILNR